jgi:hypothetical protein
MGEEASARAVTRVVGAMLVGALLGLAACAPSPAPTPTESAPSPSPSPSPVVGAADTGVEGQPQLRRSGSIEVVRDGAVLDGLEVHGEIVIRADDVTVRNTLVTSPTDHYPIHVTSGVTGALIEHVEVDNQGSTGKGIHFDGGSGTVRYVNIHSAEDGILISADDVTVEYTWIHHLARTPTSHNDAIQIRRGNDVTIRYNHLQAYNDETDDPMNAAIQIGSLVGDEPISGLEVVDNFMNGGSVTVNGGGRGEVASAVYSGNRFGRDYLHSVVGNLENSTWDRTNVFADNGEFVGGGG